MSFIEVFSFLYLTTCTVAYFSVVSGITASMLVSWFPQMEFYQMYMPVASLIFMYLAYESKREHKLFSCTCLTISVVHMFYYVTLAIDEYQRYCM